MADQEADPFILSRESGAILFAQHGGEWNVTQLFPDVATIAACLAVLGNVVAAAGATIVDEHHVVRAEHILTAEKQLTAVLGSRTEAAAVLKALDWE